jgi:peptidoglycan/xylan/chitin deacetylase (PgdA/CDA1 family)
MIWLALAIILLLVGLVYWLCLSPTSQLFGAFPYRGRTKDKVVALTFDDGPNQPYTGQLLDLLKAEAVPATFFVVGRNLEKSPEITMRAAREGHVIGNHSLSHQFRKYFLSPSFGSEIETNQRVITETTGRTPKLFRPPWLFRTPLVLATTRQLGLQPVSGTFVNNWEIFQPSAAKIAASAFRRTKPGTILIFHDGYNAQGARRDQTIAAVEMLIKRLKADGYRFVTAAELLGVAPYQA